jgi:hypothetical protein
MKRRYRLSAAAVAAVAGLLLTACSGDGTSDDEIPGADGANQSPPPDAESEPEDEAPQETEEPGDDGVDRPDIQVADFLEMVFEERETGDPVKDTILLDNEWYLMAVHEVLTTHNTEESSIAFYAEGQAILDDIGLVEWFMDEGITSAGTMRYFNREVRLVESDSDAALVSFCRDFTQVATWDFETHDVTSAADPSALPTHYETYVEKNDLGVWMAQDTTVERESDKCR